MQASSITIITGNKEIIGSAHFFTADLDSFVLRLNYKSDYVDVVFFFTNDPSLEESRVFARTIEKDEIKIITLQYFNFESAVGTYNREIYEIGKIAERQLFIRSKIARPIQDANFREIDVTFFCSR